MTIRTIFMRIFIPVALLFGLLLPTYAALAQTNTTTIAPWPYPCTTFQTNLRMGMYSNEVVNLQSFLNTQGYFSYASTGYFGSITARAVQNFQAAHGLPATGYFGPMTRTVISYSCGQPVPLPVPIPQPIPVPTYAPSVQYTSPSSGPVGTTVTLVGSGFVGQNTINFGGYITQAFASNNGTSLSFTVPQYISPSCPPGAYCAMGMSSLWVRQTTPGVYPVYVQNQNGTSNTVNFVVTDGNPSQAPVINGIDSPVQLTQGQTGSWTLRTAIPTYQNGSSLHYSVSWGDENVYAPMPMASASPSPIQTSGTFTHAYWQPGTYRPTFTVSNDAGQTASVTTTVSVVAQ